MSIFFKNILCRICNSAILAGVIIFFIGAYYCVIKAGIPFQDPPLELQIQYAVHMQQPCPSDPVGGFQIK